MNAREESGYDHKSGKVEERGGKDEGLVIWHSF